MASAFMRKTKGNECWELRLFMLTTQNSQADYKQTAVN